jgi:hypothetical protein
LKGGSKQGGFARTRNSNYQGGQKGGLTSTAKGFKGRLQGEASDKQLISEPALVLHEQTENASSGSPTQEVNQKSPTLTRSKSEGYRLGTRTVPKQESTSPTEDLRSDMNQAANFSSSCINNFSDEVQ